MPAPTRPVRPRHASRAVHRRVLGTLAAASAAIMGFAGVGGATYMQLTVGAFETHDINSLLETDADATAEPKDNSPNDFAAGQPLNIALIGTDERNDENADIGGLEGLEGMRGDTTMVLHISADRSRVEVVSIPRDSRVRISDCQLFDGSTVRGWTGKFNIALANGGINGNRGEGAACVMRTITDLTGVDFKGHFMMVDFSGFEKMVDSLGGIPMCIPNDISAPKANLELEAGAQVLDGATALGFARARTGTGLGDGTDLMRIERQQELLTNTVRKVLGANLLTDVPELTSFVRSAAESLTVDTDLARVNNIVGLAYSLRNFDTENLVFATVPWEYAGDGSGDVLWREAEAAAMWESIANDEPIVLDEPEEEPSDEPSSEPSSSPTPSSSASPDTSATPGTSASPEPLRETQQEILDSCVIP